MLIAQIQAGWPANAASLPPVMRLHRLGFS